MPGPVRLGLVDARGREFTGQLLDALLRFAPKLRRDFPALSGDDVDLAEMLEAAGERILARLSEFAGVEDIDSYTWTTIRNLARSRMRLLRNRIRRESIDAPSGRSMLDILQAPRGTQGQIESGIFMRELAAWFTPDEQAVENMHAQGWTLREIAAMRGCSVEAVEAAHRRARAKAKLVSQIREPGPQHRGPQRGGQARSVKAVTARTAGVKPGDDERKAG